MNILLTGILCNELFSGE